MLGGETLRCDGGKALKHREEARARTDGTHLFGGLSETAVRKDVLKEQFLMIRRGLELRLE